jgi:hypothetical protein
MAKKVTYLLLLTLKIFDKLRSKLFSLGTKKSVSKIIVNKILSSKPTFKNTTLTDLTSVSMYINKIIIPPVNKSTTAYIIQEDSIFLKINPR